MTHIPTQAVAIVAIGNNRGVPRVWMQGAKLRRSGFEPASEYLLETDPSSKTITLRLASAAGLGARVVSRKQAGERVDPVIDIQNREILSIFEGLQQLRVVFGPGVIHLLPLATDKRIAARLKRTSDRMASGCPLSVGSLAHGGGVLSHAVHEGMSQEGLDNELAFACELREDFVEQAMQVNPAWSDSTIALQGPMQEIAFDPWTMARLPEVDLLEAGLPCSGASVAGRAKKALDHPEAHEHVGHLVVPFLAIIAKVNPTAIVLENVPQYANSASMWIIRHQLRDLGYDVHEQVLDSAEFNALEHRSRLFMVAVTKGMQFDPAWITRPERESPILASILDDVSPDDPSWSEMTGLKAKQERDREQGKGFAMQIVTPNSERIPTLTKGIAKNRSTDPKIQHPTNPELLRIPTPGEHARAKTIPETLIQGITSKTFAHELLGQSIVHRVGVAVARAVARSLRTATPTAVGLPALAAAA